MALLGDAFVTQLTKISASIDAAHVHGAQSKAIQELMTEWLVTQDGIRTEVIDVFKSRLRPDFVADLGGDRGVLIEVERGGAVTNNHDLKDLWKCHLCASTQHLFLLVPHANWNKHGNVRERPHKRSSARLSTFFDDSRTYVDVLSAWVIGYGLEHAVTSELAANAEAGEAAEADADLQVMASDG